MRLKHYSLRTERCYCDWIERFIRFHGKRHPRDLGEEEVSAFLTHLARELNVAASTQNQAFRLRAARPEESWLRRPVGRG